MNIEQFRDELNIDLTKITDDFNSRLQYNTEKLIERINEDIDILEGLLNAQ